MHIRELSVYQCIVLIHYTQECVAFPITSRNQQCLSNESWRQLLNLTRPARMNSYHVGYFLSVIVDTRSLPRVAYARVIILPTEMSFFQRRK